MLKILASIDKCYSFTLDDEATTEGRYFTLQVNNRVFEVWLTRKKEEDSDTSAAS